MGSKIIKQFIMAISISGFGYRLIGSFSSGELAMKGLGEFKERHQMTMMDGESEPVICIPYMFVLQPDKVYLNSHAPYGSYDQFIIDLREVPAVWRPDMEIANQLDGAINEPS